MGHHGHHHDHHAHASRRRLVAALSVTAIIFLAEIIGALLAGSLALLADAGHMLVDSLGLVIALFAASLMSKPRTDTHTWGYARAEVVAAAAQAGMLLVICVLVLIEAMKRLVFPEPVLSGWMLLIGIVGLVGNVCSLLILASSRRANLNMRAAFLEVANDALGSIAVILAALLGWWTGWAQWDVIASLAIVALMAPRAVVLLKDALDILVERVPREVDLGEVRDHLLRQPHVIDVHDLHVSTIATGMLQMTAHITLEEHCFTSGHSAQILHDIQRCLAEHFPVSIEHSTIQLDTATHRDHELLSH